MVKTLYSILHRSLDLTIQKQFDVNISESEIIYLTLHIHHFEERINQS